MIKRKITQKIILIAIFGLFGLTIINTMMINVKAVTTEKTFVSLNDRLVTLSSGSITAKGRTQTGSSWYYTSASDSSGGSILVEQAQPYVDPDGIIDYPTETQTVDNADGTKTVTNIYHRSLPYQWDINIWTAVPLVSSIPSYTTESGKIVTSRLYVGHQLATYLDKQTYRYTAKWDDAKAVPVPAFILSYVAPQSPAVKGLQDGNDFWETYHYQESIVNIPYYKFTGQTKTLPIDDPYAMYQEQQNLIKSHFTTNYAIGNINVKTLLQIAPLVGMSPTLNTTDGTLSLQDQWVDFGGITKLNSYDETGFCNKPTDAVSWFNEFGSKSQLNAESDDDQSTAHETPPSPITYDPRDNGGDQASSNLVKMTFSGTDLYSSVPTLQANTVVGSNLKQNTNDVFAYSPSQGKTYGTLVSSNIDQLNNVYDWEINLNNFNLVPALYLHKQTVNVKYTELWYDTNPPILGLKAPDTYKVTHNAEDKEMNFLLGFEVNNVYAHVRLQATIDARSKYQMILQQGDDNSHLGTPDDINGKTIWDNSPVGEKNFNYISVGQKDTVSLISDFFKANWGWILLVVIGVVGVVILIGVSKAGGAISMVTGGNRQPKIIRQSIQEPQVNRTFFNRQPVQPQPNIMVTQPQQPIYRLPPNQPLRPLPQPQQSVVYQPPIEYQQLANQPSSPPKPRFDPNTGKQIFYDADGNRIQ